MAERRKRKPSSNVYTVLMAVAFIALLLGVIFVWMRFSEVTGESNPFTAHALPMTDAVALLRSALPL